MYIYMCVYVCMCVCLGVYILQENPNCRKKKKMMGLQETVMDVDPLSALPFFECWV